MRRTSTRLAIVFATVLVATVTRLVPAEAATPSLFVDDIEWFEEPRGIPAPTITVRLSAPTDHDVTVNLATADGTAHGGYNFGPESDFYPVLQRVTIPAGEIGPPQEINLFINNDDVVEGDETFSLRLYESSGAPIADGRATVLVHNASSDTDPPPPVVDRTDVLVDDVDASASIVVRLGAYSATVQTVTVRTRSFGEATAGEDYEETTAVLRFPAGTLGRRFDIPILGDQLDEGTEEFLVEVVYGFSTVRFEETGQNEVNIFDDDGPSAK